MEPDGDKPAPEDDPPADEAGDAGEAPAEVAGHKPEEAAAAEADEGDAEADEGDDQADEAAPGGSRRNMVLALTVLAAVLVGILVLAITTGSGGSSATGTTPTSQPTASTVTGGLPPAALSTFHDPVTGFTLQYPSGWDVAQLPDGELRFEVLQGTDGALVKVLPIEQETTPANLGNLKPVVDGILATNPLPNQRILKTSAITVNGMIGYWYVYTFTDQASNLEAAHAHYFLFKGHSLFSIVFQALPSDDINRLDGIFNQMINSFKVDDNPPTPSIVPSTAAPTTTP